eukprot:5883442-Amphidinium_carterae.1
MVWDPQESTWQDTSSPPNHKPNCTNIEREARKTLKECSIYHIPEMCTYAKHFKSDLNSAMKLARGITTEARSLRASEL